MMFQTTQGLFNQQPINMGEQPINMGERQSRISTQAKARNRARSRDRKVIQNDYRKSKKGRKGDSLTRMIAQSEIGFARNETDRLAS